MDLPAEQPPSRCMQWRGPIMGVIGVVFLIVGVVCVVLTGQSPALFWVGIAFIVFAVVHFCICCGTCAYAQNGGNTYHVTNHFASSDSSSDSKQLLPANDVSSRSFTTTVRTSKMELW
jgi:hypothetical protein